MATGFKVFKYEEETRQLRTEIIETWAKSRRIETITDIAELTVLYRQQIAEKLADIDCPTAPDIDLLKLAELAGLAELACDCNASGDYATRDFIQWLLPRFDEAKDFIFIASTEQEATGALKCWTYSQDWEVADEELVNWAKVPAKIWES